MTFKILSPIKFFLLHLLFFFSTSVVVAGPLVTPNPKLKNTVNIRDVRTGIIVNISDSLIIMELQEMFKRAKKTGNTISGLKTYSHNIDFSERWLVNLDTGEIGILRKMVGDVYTLESEDLDRLKKIISTMR